MQNETSSSRKGLGFAPSCAGYLSRDLHRVQNLWYKSRLFKQILFKITDVTWNCSAYSAKLVVQLETIQNEDT